MDDPNNNNWVASSLPTTIKILHFIKGLMILKIEYSSFKSVNFNTYEYDD